MILLLARNGSGVLQWSLREPDDFKRLKLEVDRLVSGDDVERALLSRGIGHAAPGQDGSSAVFIAPDFIRSLLTEAATPEWERGFDKMLDYARSHGWWDADAGLVRIHIETLGAAN